jgi:membrane protease subunit HflK
MILRMSEQHHHHAPPTAPEIPVTDTGARALEEALRSSFVIVKIVMFLLAALFVFSGMKTVGPQERAVILRFGQPTGGDTGQLLGPGLHWAWPYPIDEVVTVPITEIQKVTSTIGYSLSAGDELLGRKANPVPSLNPATDGYLVMGDNNIMHARATLGYRITDPIAYVFNFLNASNCLQNALNNALLYAAARTPADEALTNNAAFKETVLVRLRQQIENHRLGVTIEPGSEVKVLPPAYVQPDFDAVTAAQQDRSKAELAALGDAETTVRNAQTEANLILNAAESERNRVVQDVQSFAKSFTAQLPQYQANPELFRQRVLTERWQRILSRADDKFFQLEPLVPGQTELRLQLSREPQKARAAQPNP